MQIANKNKILNILQRPFASLPVAIDLPRLSSLMSVERKNANGDVELAYSPTDSVTTNLRLLLSTLSNDLEPEAGRDVDKAFDAYFSKGNIEVARVLVKFLQQEFGGDESKVVRVVKSCNQAVISPALIELKMSMGVTNMTKDVAHSWFITITIEHNKEIFVRTRKKEQHINNLFQFQWQLVLHYDENVRCKGIDLQVSDLMFSEALHTTQTDRKEEVKQLLSRYCTPEVLGQADNRSWEFNKTRLDSAGRKMSNGERPEIMIGRAKILTPKGPAPEVPATEGEKPVSARQHENSNGEESAPLTPVGENHHDEKGTEKKGHARKKSRDKGVKRKKEVEKEKGKEKEKEKEKEAETEKQQNEHSKEKEKESNLGPRQLSASKLPDAPKIRVVNYPNGDRYEGELKDGVRHGRGVYTSHTGEVYVGEYRGGKRHGRGVYTLPDGARYDGDFLDGQPNGKGVYVWANGDIYTGDFINDEFDGHGTWSSARGDSYRGEFKRGKREGIGHSMTFTGNKYEGQWRNGMKDGHGIFSFSNGEKYEGQFSENLFDGKGTYFYPTGERVVGIFEAGKLVEVISQEGK